MGLTFVVLLINVRLDKSYLPLRLIRVTHFISSLDDTYIVDEYRGGCLNN